MLSQITRPAAPCLGPRFAGPLLSVLVAAVLSACANYAGIRSDKQIAEPTTYTTTQSIPSETQQKLDVIANEVLLDANEWGGHLAAMASEEMESFYEIPNRYPKANTC